MTLKDGDPIYVGCFLLIIANSTTYTILLYNFFKNRLQQTFVVLVLRGGNLILELTETPYTRVS